MVTNSERKPMSQPAIFCSNKKCRIRLGRNHKRDPESQAPYCEKCFEQRSTQSEAEEQLRDGLKRQNEMYWMIFRQRPRPDVITIPPANTEAWA